MHVYHGTTIENARSILKNGWNHNSTQNWNCSSPNHVYFYFSQENEEEAIAMAIEAGQIAAALQNSKHENLALFVMEIPEDEEDTLTYYRDYSCPNMDRIALEIPVEMLEQYPIKMIEVKDVYLPSMRLGYIPKNNDYLATIPLSNTEKLLFEAMKRCDNSSFDMTLFDVSTCQIYGQIPTILHSF